MFQNSLEKTNFFTFIGNLFSKRNIFIDNKKHKPLTICVI